MVAQSSSTVFSVETATSRITRGGDVAAARVVGALHLDLFCVLLCTHETHHSCLTVVGQGPSDDLLDLRLKRAANTLTVTTLKRATYSIVFDT